MPFTPYLIRQAKRANKVSNPLLETALVGHTRVTTDYAGGPRSVVQNGRTAHIAKSRHREALPNDAQHSRAGTITARQPGDDITSFRTAPLPGQPFRNTAAPTAGASGPAPHARDGFQGGAVTFSVVIPMYNKAKFIAETLESVFAQTHPAQEIIVVDDASTDDGPAIVEAIDHPRLRLVRQANAGPGLARNAGIRTARGEWVAFLDADDLWHPDHLKVHAASIRRHPGVGIVGSGLRRSRNPSSDIASLEPRADRSRYIDYMAEVAEQIDSRRTDGEPLCSSSASVRRDVALHTGGFGATYPGEDTAFWLKVALNSPVATTEEKTTLYRLQTGGIMDCHNAWSIDRVMENPLRRTLKDSLAGDVPEAARSSLERYLLALDTYALRGMLSAGRIGQAKKLAGMLTAGSESRLGSVGILMKMPTLLSRMTLSAYRNKGRIVRLIEKVRPRAR